MNATLSTNDADLLARLRAGDDNAFTTLVNDHAGRMLAVARGILRNEEDAADAVQEAFLQAFKAIAKFEGNASPATWLHRIVVNACLMKRRSAARHSTYSLDDLLPQFDDSGHHAEPICRWSGRACDRILSEESKTQIFACLEQLPEDYREIILLRDLQELDTDETARQLNITTGTVKTRLHRARQALRTLLSQFMEAGTN